MNSPFCASQGRAGRGQTLLFALPLRGQQAVIPAGTADPTYVQARSTRPHPIFFPDQLEPTIPFSCAVVDRRFMKHLCKLVPGPRRHRRRLAGIWDQKTQFERNLRCCKAVAIPALEMVFQHSTVNSCVGNDFPVQHSQLRRWKGFSCSAQSTPVLEIILLHSKVNSRAGNHFPIQQKRLQHSKVNFRTATA